MNNTVNVIFTIRYFYPFVGGTERQALALASTLLKKGVSVTIVTSRFERQWPRCDSINGVTVKRLYSPRIKVVGAFVFLACLVVYIIQHRKQFSLIHTFQIGYTSSVSILLGMLLKKPSVLKLASSGWGGDIRRAKKTLSGKVFLYMAKKASRIIMVSKTVERELLAEGVNNARLSYIVNGVDLVHFKPCEEKKQLRNALGIPDKKTVIYTGRLAPEKGVDFLIRSFLKVETSIGCQLIIIAEGPEMKNVMRLLNNCNAKESILLLQGVNVVANYLNAADLFILPSHFEGLSNSLLEAMACGLPVISTRVGGSIDIIEDGTNGLLVDCNSEQQLTQAIVYVLNNFLLATNLGTHARKTIEAHHDLNIITDKYVALYKNLTQSIV